MAQRIGELGLQIDRWPVTGSEDHPYLLSMVCITMFDSKPSEQDVVNVMKELGKCHVEPNNRNSGTYRKRKVPRSSTDNVTG